jgi:hypothetical protein
MENGYLRGRGETGHRQDVLLKRLLKGKQGASHLWCAVGVQFGPILGLHRLSFWWSNVLQLRCMFSALCQGLDTQLGPQASQQPVSPTTAATAAYAAAAAAEVSRGAVVNGLEWMQASGSVLAVVGCMHVD